MVPNWAFEQSAVRKSGLRGRLETEKRVIREVGENSVGCDVFKGQRGSVSEGGGRIDHLCQMLLKGRSNENGEFTMYFAP